MDALVPYCVSMAGFIFERRSTVLVREMVDSQAMEDEIHKRFLRIRASPV
jgi:hypothetical protein